MSCEIGLVVVDDEKQGVYGVLKKLSESFADKLGVSRKKALSLCYEVLLKKSKTAHEALPEDWNDGDVLNSILLEIHKRSLVKNSWTAEQCNKVLKYFEELHRHKNSDCYQNSVGPALKMILSIEYNAKKIPLKEKKADRFFSTDTISSYLNNLKTYGREKEEMDFFSFAKFQGLPHSLSEGNFFCFKLGNQLLTFDYVFRRENYKKVRKSSNDLDEGFVTPNEDHVEKSPCFEIACLPAPKRKKKFDWDFGVVSVPPSRHKTWETFDLIGCSYKEPPFIHKDILLQQWLCTAPLVTYISRERLLTEIIALLIGIPSSTFLFNGDTFIVRDNIYSDELTPSALTAFCQDLIEAGAAFKVLSNISENELDDDVFTSAFKIGLKEYLYKYQTFINHAYEEYKGKGYLKFVISIRPLTEQVTYLKKVLAYDDTMKGVSLLKHLFNLMGCAASSSIFHILSYLFLLPCIYFFRIIDDWVFLGKWNTNLPLTPYSMANVNDRKSWVEAHKPIYSEAPWFLPNQDLAHCGKALYLLSLSKNSENFLSLLRSNNRPRVKLCLDLEELDTLKEECEKYYEEGTNMFCINEEKIDLVQCALDAAKKKNEAFESRRIEEKMKEIKKKKNELLLREEDLVRSAKNKALRKQQDITENERVAKEQEKILHREQEETLERAKVIYEKYKHVLDEHEKRMTRHEWKLKRHALDEKRKEFLSKYENTFDLTLLLPASASEVEEGCLTENSLHMSPETHERFKTLGNTEGQNLLEVDENIKSGIQDFIDREGINENMRSNSIPESVIVNVNYVNTESTQSSDENKNLNSELVQVSESVVSSDANGNRRMELIQEINYENKEVESQLDVELNTVNIPEKIEMIQNEEKLTDLEKNRLKILGSDLGRGTDIRLHIWDDETERNKRNMMESHLHFDYDLTEVKKDTVVESFPEKVERNKIQTRVEKNPRKIDVQPPSPLKNILAFQQSVSEESEKISLDLQNREDPILNGIKGQEDSDNLSDIKITYKWNEDIDKNRIMKIFKSKRPNIIPDKDIDYALLNKLVQSSLKIVLSTQVKLVNDALLRMFLSEFGLIKVAQKLREYFFLHGEFGKRLTSSLSKAIENEEPSSLLTFYRLRNILVEACKGDIKELSFFVKETPVVFDHTNSKVLSCLDLTYKFEWPLNLIFTDVAISKYNSIFEYMFSLHRVAWHLEEVWLSLNFKSVLLKGYQYTQIQLYRHVMLQFVCTIRSYIVTTVIESCWQDFIKNASKVKDLDELYKRHAAYILDIKFKCFLDEKSGRLMLQIQKLLSHILIFCRTLRFGEWNVSDNEEYTHSNFKKLKNTFSSFLHLARTVTKYVEKLVKISYQKELENLYYFLTINSFYIS